MSARSKILRENMKELFKTIAKLLLIQIAIVLFAWWVYEAAIDPIDVSELKEITFYPDKIDTFRGRMGKSYGDIYRIRYGEDNFVLALGPDYQAPVTALKETEKYTVLYQPAGFWDRPMHHTACSVVGTETVLYTLEDYNRARTDGVLICSILLGVIEIGWSMLAVFFIGASWFPLPPKPPKKKRVVPQGEDICVAHNPNTSIKKQKRRKKEQQKRTKMK